jgi:hypothetical protein
LGCSSLELEAVASSEQETQKILALGLSHEENLVEASKLDTPHKVVVVHSSTKCRDEKIQNDIDLKDSVNKYADSVIEVIILEDGSKFIGPEISENQLKMEF